MSQAHNLVEVSPPRLGIVSSLRAGVRAHLRRSGAAPGRAVVAGSGISGVLDSDFLLSADSGYPA